MRKQTFLLSLLLVLIALFSSRELFKPGYFTMHDDLQVMRLYQMDKCFKDGQLPCRWAPDMGAAYGQPLFNFYSAFPYYLGQSIHALGFSFVDTAKALILLAVVFSSLFSFYFLLQIASPVPAFFGALVYTFFPYRVLDIFVRGAISESYGLALLPGVLGGLIKLIKKPEKITIVTTALFIAAFLSTHNVTVMLSAIFIVVICLIYLIKEGITKEKIQALMISSFIGLGLSAFFLFPVIFEKGLSQTDYLIKDYYKFDNHFLSIKQLFTPTPWGFGSPSIGPGPVLSFFIGFVGLIVLSTTPIFVLLSRKDKFKQLTLSVFFILSFLSIFMIHSKSFHIWNSISTLHYAQFPWRFLGITALLISALSALQIEVIKQKRFLIIFLSILVIISTSSLFRFGRYLPNVTDENKLQGAEYENQARAALLDYLPNSSTKIPNSLAPSMPQIIKGNVSTNYFDKRSNYFSSEFDVYSNDAEVRFPVVYFPGWTLYQNRLPAPISITSDNDYGLITVRLSSGHHLIQGFFEDTPIRFRSNLISVISLIALLLFIKYFRENEK